MPISYAYSQDMPDVGSFSTSLGDVPVTVSYSVHADHTVKTSFSYLGASYDFTLSRWKGKKFTDFQLKFHEVYDDVALYGSSTSDADGLPTISTTPGQKLAIVIRAVRDSFLYLDTLLRTQKNCIIDYSSWYRERYWDNLDTYAGYVQLVTCHCIVHAEFQARPFTFAVVQFIVPPCSK